MRASADRPKRDPKSMDFSPNPRKNDRTRNFPADSRRCSRIHRPPLPCDPHARYPRTGTRQQNEEIPQFHRPEHRSRWRLPLRNAPRPERSRPLHTLRPSPPESRRQTVCRRTLRRSHRPAKLRNSAQNRIKISSLFEFDQIPPKFLKSEAKIIQLPKNEKTDCLSLLFSSRSHSSHPG